MRDGRLDDFSHRIVSVRGVLNREGATSTDSGVRGGWHFAAGVCTSRGNLDLELIPALWEPASAVWPCEYLCAQAMGHARSAARGDARVDILVLPVAHIVTKGQARRETR